jgi:hypothetical protein
MAIFRGNKIRGGQIQDKTVDGAKIINDALTDTHIASDAAISESKLDIDWHAHTEVLQDKKVVDYVQADNLTVEGQVINLETLIPEISDVPNVTSDGTDEGIIVDNPKNVIRYGRSSDGEPIMTQIDGVDYEVKGKVTYNSTNGNYNLEFYTNSGTDGAEVAYDLSSVHNKTGASLTDSGDGLTFNFPDDELQSGTVTLYDNGVEVTSGFTIDHANGTVTFDTSPGTPVTADYDYAGPVDIDIQYARRFNLNTIGEMFAANEKFVHNAADITSTLNIEQVAKDLYGSTYSLDRDGDANLSTSLADQIANETSRAQSAEQANAQAISDEESARQNADANLQNQLDTLNGDATVTGSVDSKIKSQVLDPLSSDAAGNGAAMVAIEPVSGMDTATTVQDAIEYLKNNGSDAVTTLEGDLSSTEADNSGATLVGVDGSFGYDGGTTVEAVLQDHETRLDVIEGDASTEGSIDNKIKTQVTDPLADDNADGSGQAGATLVAVDANEAFNGANVEAVLVDHESRITDLENGLGNGTDRSETTNGYFTAVSFDTIDARLEDSESIVDAELDRIDDRYNTDKNRAATTNGVFAAADKATLDARFEDIENEVDAKSNEIETARGSADDLNGRLSVSLNDDGTLVNGEQIHSHKKYTYTMTSNQTQVILPNGEYFNISGATGSGSVATDTVQVYVNGILQANGINFTELEDTEDTTKGVGVDFGTEELVSGDVVVIEWVENNEQ